MKMRLRIGVLSVFVLLARTCAIGAAGAEVRTQSTATNSPAEPKTELQVGKSSIWQDGIGNGFLSSAQSVTVEAGVALGMSKLGSHQAHDLALTSLSYGHMLGPVLGAGHWYRGNFEFRAELFGGGQYSPSKR